MGVLEPPGPSLADRCRILLQIAIFVSDVLRRKRLSSPQHPVRPCASKSRLVPLRGFSFRAVSDTVGALENDGADIKGCHN